MIKACERAVQFGARCRESALGDNAGVCAEHLGKEAPRAPAPDMVLVKFTLAPAIAGVAAQIFRDVPRLEEHIEKSHEAIAKAAGLQFKGVRASDKGPGDSGTPVFGKPGLKDVTLAPLKQELERAGFVLADVHTFANKAGKQMLVLGYHMGGQPVVLRDDQQAFVDRTWTVNWGYAHVWANVPEMEAVAGDVRFRYILLEDRGDKLLVQVTSPRMDETAEVSKKEIRESRLTCLHTVNMGGPSKGFQSALTYADGLWDIK